MKVIIHAGSLKTGSTYIQRVLWGNIPALRKSGVLLPSTGVVTEHHYNIARACGFGYKADSLSPNCAAEIVEKLLLELKESSLPCAVLSSEHFDINATQLSIKALADALAGHEVTVLLYLRNQVDLAQSIYFEYIKWGGTASFSTFIARELRNGFFFYDERIAIWLASGFQLVVKDYNRERENLILSFLAGLPHLLDCEELVMPMGEVNSSLAPEVMEYLRLANVSEPNPAKRREFYVSLYRRLHLKKSRWTRSSRITLPQNLVAMLPELSRRNLNVSCMLGLGPDFLQGDLSTYSSSLQPSRDLDMASFEADLQAEEI